MWFSAGNCRVAPSKPAPMARLLAGILACAAVAAPTGASTLPDFYGQYAEQAINDARARTINPLERTLQ